MIDRLLDAALAVVFVRLVRQVRRQQASEDAAIRERILNAPPDRYTYGEVWY